MMHLDKHGLPVQANGDANDQLQRVSMLAAAWQIAEGAHSTEIWSTALKSCQALHSRMLQPRPGIWARFYQAETSSTSADQIISALAASVIADWPDEIAATFIRCLLRLGFAQNYRNSLDGSNSLQIPDFMFFRALPLFTRVHVTLYPLVLLTDTLLLLAAIAAVGPVWKDGKGFAKRSPDDVDDNVIILTLIACNARMATPLSRLAAKIYAKFRPWNYGCDLSIPPCHPVVGALFWYFRPQTGANPEIAEALIPAVEKYILNNR